MFPVVQPYGERPGDWAVQSAHRSLEVAFAAIDALTAKMTKTDAPSDAIELLVVNQFGENGVDAHAKCADSPG